MRPRPAKRAAMVVCVAIIAAACGAQSQPEQLSIYGPYVGPEADVFGEVIEGFEEETGITVSYVGSASFQSDFNERVTTADLPDITILPQPALLTSLAEADLILELDETITEEITDTVGEQWAALVAPRGAAFGVPYRFVVKSLVWHRVDVFEDMGYEVPETLAELRDLTEQMLRDGQTPWCAGMDTSLSTGWWATDWIEDLVLRQNGVDFYWSWAGLDVPFTESNVVQAMRDFQQLVAADRMSFGGRRAVLNVRVEDAIDPMFSDPPGCLMHKQASFQPLWLPEGVEYGDGELEVFALPPTEPGPAPLVVSGEIVVATSNDAATVRFLRYLLTDESFDPWRKLGGSLIARADPEEGASSSPLDMWLAELVDGTDTVVFDASDVMPQVVGTGTFFSGMIDLVAGTPAIDVASMIQDSVNSLTPG